MAQRTKIQWKAVSAQQRNSGKESKYSAKRKTAKFTVTLILSKVK